MKASDLTADLCSSKPPPTPPATTPDVIMSMTMAPTFTLKQQKKRGRVRCIDHKEEMVADFVRSPQKVYPRSPERSQTTLWTLKELVSWSTLEVQSTAPFLMCMCANVPDSGFWGVVSLRL